jgi:hypothetical protein
MKERCIRDEREGVVGVERQSLHRKYRGEKQGVTLEK